MPDAVAVKTDQAGKLFRDIPCCVTRCFEPGARTRTEGLLSLCDDCER